MVESSNEKHNESTKDGSPFNGSQIDLINDHLNGEKIDFVDEGLDKEYMELEQEAT